MVGRRRRTRQGVARAALEQEAAEIIEARIADGRPPPEVWRAAAERRAKKSPRVDSWYRPPGVVGREFVLRTVHLPPQAVPSAAAAPGPRPVPGPRPIRLAAGTSN